MVHPDLDSLAKLVHQRCQQRRARRFRCLACAPKSVGEDAEFQLWVASQCIPQGLDEFAFGFANVQRREEDAPLCMSDPILGQLALSRCAREPLTFNVS